MRVYAEANRPNGMRVQKAMRVIDARTHDRARRGTRLTPTAMETLKRPSDNQGTEVNLRVERKYDLHTWDIPYKISNICISSMICLRVWHWMCQNTLYNFASDVICAALIVNKERKLHSHYFIRSSEHEFNIYMYIHI